MAIASPLGAEAVAARAAFEALADNSLDYLAPVARLRSIGQTLGTTIGDLRDADIDVGLLDAHGAAGRDLRVLAERYEEQLSQAALVDHAALFRIAAEAVPRTAALPVSGPLLLLDVGVRDDATAGLVRALCAQASEVLATVPHGDDWTMRMLSGLPDAGVQPVTDEEESDAGALSRVRRFLFSTDSPPELTEPTVDPQQVTMFSAPGEGRECVEMARAAMQEARRGVPFDRMAVLVRAPQLYAGLLETALNRAGISGWFTRGTRAPDPSGRAFLALLACAAEGLSARRFAEYLSLAQVPALSAEGAPPSAPAAWVPPDTADSDLPAPAQLSLFDRFDTREGAGESAEAEVVAVGVDDDQPVLAGSLRTPCTGTDCWSSRRSSAVVIDGRVGWMGWPTSWHSVGTSARARNRSRPGCGRSTAICETSVTFAALRFPSSTVWRLCPYERPGASGSTGSKRSSRWLLSAPTAYWPSWAS